MFLSDSCNRLPLLPAYSRRMTEAKKAGIVLKPVLIGFILGLAMVGASRLASQEADGPQLTSATARSELRGVAIGHVAARLPHGTVHRRFGA